MAIRSRIVAVVVFLAAVVGIFGVVSAQTRGPQDDWAYPEWSYRLMVRVPDAAHRADVNTARMALGDQAVHCRPNGADLRVTSRSGQAVPHKAVTDGESGKLELEFEVDGPGTDFYVYYGNAQAERSVSEWAQQLGGLEVEVRPTAGRVSVPQIRGRRALERSRQYTVSRILVEAHRGRKPYGRREWGQINDLENPLRPEEHGLNPRAEPDDFYLSKYEGTLLAPRDGKYDFAINADDAAIFGIRREGKIQWVCWRPEAGISAEWDDHAYPGTVARDAENPARRSKVPLEWGLHRITYYHIENIGGQLAALAWEPPGSEGFDLVPVSAFARYLPVRVMGRQGRGGAELTPYFRAIHLYNLRINNSELVFPNYRFEVVNGWDDVGTGRLKCTWDLGDDTSAEGAAVEHEYATSGPIPVALTVTAPDGRSASVKRTLRPPESPVSEMRVQMYMQAGDVLLAEPAQGESHLTLEVMLSARDGQKRRFDLVVGEARRGESEVFKRRQVTLEPTSARQEQQWQSVDARVPLTGKDMELDVQLRLKDRVVVSRRVHAASVAGPLDGLRLDETRTLRNTEGALVRLVPAGMSRKEADPRKLATADGTVRVLVLDELLAGPPGAAPAAGYVGMVQELLAERYSGLQFKMVRSSGPADLGSDPLSKLMHTVETVGKVDPHIVLVVWPLQALVDGLPVEQYEAYLAATTDHLLARTEAEVFLVCLPPLLGREDASRRYATATKRTALRKGVKAVDLYSRFLLQEDWKSLFRSDLRRYPSYTLYPGRGGQVEIAREVYANILEFVHDELAAAERAVQLRRRADR